MASGLLVGISKMMEEVHQWSVVLFSGGLNIKDETRFLSQLFFSQLNLQRPWQSGTMDYWYRSMDAANN